MRDQSIRSLRTVAGQYLHHVASLRAGVIARHEDDRPSRRAPFGRAARRRFAAQGSASRRRVAMTSRRACRERPPGTYSPQPAKVEVEPLRIAYVESADLTWGVHSAQAMLYVEEDPIRIQCLCAEGGRGPCPHALTAIDEALDLLRVPSPARDRLASILATPLWSRFLHAFGEELGRHGSAARLDQRLAWRIGGTGRGGGNRAPPPEADEGRRLLTGAARPARSAPAAPRRVHRSPRRARRERAARGLRRDAQRARGDRSPTRASRGPWRRSSATRSSSWKHGPGSAPRPSQRASPARG